MQHLDCQTLRLLYCEFLLVVLFQDALRIRHVGTNTGCLPPAVVSGGVRVVELEAVVLIPARIEERDTEWT